MTRRLKYRVDEFDADLRDHLNSLRKKKSVIWCGDLNVAHQEIDIYDATKTGAGFTKEERASFSKTLDSGWIDTWRKLHPKEVKYSFWSIRAKCRGPNKGKRLDYFVVNKEMEEAVESAEVLDKVLGSDHCPIHLTIDMSKI